MFKRMCSFLGVGLLVFATSAGAQTASGQTYITNLVTGWQTEGFGLQTTLPIVNPAHCAVTDSYQVDISVPGYKTYYAAALLAFGAGKSVNVTVSNSVCTQGRPSIIGVWVYAS